MGVKNFDFLPWIWTTADEITGTIAVDMPNYLARRISAISTHKHYRSERIPFLHVTLMWSLIRAALSASILPVLIFDGPPEILKRPCNPELLQHARNLYNRFNHERDPYDELIVESLTKSPALYSYFAQFHVADVARALGIPTVIAPSEAEMYAAVLSRDSLATTVISNDIDALLFGAHHVTKQLVLSRNEIFRVVQRDVLKIIGLTLSQLRDLAIICGCDFYKGGLKGIGPRRGISLLLRHKDLDGVLRARGFKHHQREQFLLAREILDEADHLRADTLPLRLNPPLTSKLESMLRFVIGSERAERMAENSIQLWREFGFKQATLESWF